MTAGSGRVNSRTSLTVTTTPVWASVSRSETLAATVASYGTGVRRVSASTRLRVTLASSGTSLVPAAPANLTLTPATAATLTLDGA